MSDTIDINVYETTEEVTINVTPNVIEVNINKITGGGGGTQTLAQTLDLGNQTGGENILVNNADAIELENTSLLKKGSYDFGGNGGISRVCSVGYEDMWQSGIRHVFDNNGLIRNSTNCFDIVPDSSFDVTLRFRVDSIWTLDDGTSYICTDATEGAAVWEIYNSISNLVPYTGANDDVNIGANDLYTNKVFLYDEPNDNYGSIHYSDGDFHVEDADGHKLLVIEDGFMQLHLSDTIQSNLWTTLLTETRNHYLPNNSGTIALTSDITGTNSGTNTGDETATTIKDKLGITTLSGSNTGDETSSTIASKIGFLPFKFIQTSQTAHAGTTFETIVATATINGGTFNSSDVMKAIFKCTKGVTTSNVTLRLKINTTNSLSGATQIAILSVTTALQFGKLKRDYDLFGGNLYGFNFTSSLASDDITSGTIGQSTSYNTANTLYFFWTIQLGTSGDSAIPNLANLTN